MAGKRNPPNLGHKKSVISPIIQAPSQITPNTSPLAGEPHDADHPNRSTRRVPQQPSLNPRRSIGSRNILNAKQAQRRVKQQEAKSNRSKGFDQQQRTISPLTGPRNSTDSAQAEAKAKLEALSVWKKGVESDHQQRTHLTRIEPRNSKEFAQAQALAKLEALSVRNSGIEFDHQRRTTSPLVESPDKEFAQAEALAKLEALSVRNRGVEFDHHQGIISLPTGPRDSKESAQAQQIAKLEALSRPFNQENRSNHQQHIVAPPIASRNNTKFEQCEEKANMLVVSSFGTYDIFDAQQSNAPPATESRDRVEFVSDSASLQARRHARHRATSSSRVIVSITSHSETQRSFAARDNIDLGIISPNLQTRKTRKSKASSSKGKKSLHPVRMLGIRRPPRTSFAPNHLGSSALQSARKIFGRPKRGHPGKISPIMPSLRAESKEKVRYYSNKRASGGISHSESHHSIPDPSQQSNSYPPQMTKHTSSEKNMFSGLPTKHRAPRCLLDLSSNSVTQLGASNAPDMPTRNPRAPPSAALESAPEAPGTAWDSLCVLWGNGSGRDSHIALFRHEERRVPKPKVGKAVKWKAFFPDLWTSLKENGEVQGMTTGWKRVGSGAREMGGTMTARGRLERYM